MLRRRHGGRGYRDEEELIPLVRNYDGSSTEEAGPSTESNQKLRLMVLGGDDALMDKACGTILKTRNKNAPFEFEKLEPGNADACGRQVSVLKTPYAWLEHLNSFLFFSRRVKAIRKEIESYESQMFPGPHAFLLVHRDVKNSGREYYLLKALSKVFGKEVLEYCMVLFMDEAKHNDPRKNDCLKMCGSRYHILHNTEESLNELFKKIETMTESKDSSFFTNHLECFRKANDYFQEEYDKKENKLRKELKDSKDRETQLSKELKDLKDRETQLSKELKDLKDRETQLSKELKDLKEKQDKVREELNTSNHLNKELIIYKDRERKLSKDLNDSKDRKKQMKEELKTSIYLKKQLNEELIIYKDRERHLSKDLNDSKDRTNQMKEELKTLTHREKQLDEELIVYKDRERQLKKELNDSRDRENQLRDNIKQLEEFKEQLENNLADARVKEDSCLHERELNLHMREKQLDDKENDLEIREREVRSRELHQTTADPAVSRDKSRPPDEHEEELTSRDGSQASGLPGIQKPVR